MPNKKFLDLALFRDYVSSPQAIREKSELILEQCGDKDVLDMGCIDHSFKTALELGDNWLHKKIGKVSKTLTGLDILEDDARVLNEKGYNIEIGNAEDFNLDRKFDCIVAGDLIEHLSNVGQFLDAVKQHMHGDSVFIVTTPNPFNIEQTWQAIFNKSVVVNTQHTEWLDPITLWQIFDRHNLTIVDFYWVETRFTNYIWSSRWRHLINPLTNFLQKRYPLLRRDFGVMAVPKQPV